MILRSLPIVAAAAALWAGSPVRAADMDMLLSAPELEISESRTGPYLRADIFYDVETDAGVARSLGSVGLAGGGGHLKDAAGFMLGAGYQFTDMLRADLTARYAAPDFTAGPVFLPGCGALCGAREDADGREWELLANTYVDFGTIGGFTPYLGGSLGAVHLSLRDPVLTVCGSASCQTLGGSRDDEWRLAFGGSAGVAYDMTDAVSLDIGYRYLRVEGEGGYGFDLAGAGGAGTVLAAAPDDHDRHSIRVGLRYKLW